MYRNETKNIQYPGGLAVRPGEGRMVDACFCPDDGPELFKVEDILGLTVKKAIAEISNLSDEQLALVIEAEEATDKPRKSILDAYGDALESREIEFARTATLEHLESLEDSELQEKLLDDGYSDDDKALIQSVLDDRISKQVNETDED